MTSALFPSSRDIGFAVILRTTLSLFALAISPLLMFCYIFSCVLSGFTDISHAQDAGADLKPMFNGTDLSGWVRTNTPAETWTYRDGVLYCTGKPIGELRTDKMYQNFIMELEWRHLVPGGNAGIFVWADDIPARGVPFHRGIEVQVLENSYGNTQSHTTHGDIFPIHGAKMTPINGRGGDRAFPSEMLSKPAPEWNHYRIECRDGEVALSVNGKLVTRGKDSVPRKGYICLESEGGKVEYRNVKIAELPGSEVPAEQVAISDRGYHCIYSGLDLRGWTATPSLDSWQTSDWVLRHKGGEQASVLKYESKMAIERFVVDIRRTDATRRVTIVLDPQTAIPVDAPEIAAHLVALGGWNRIEGVRQADGWSLTVNGQQLVTPVKSTATASLTFAVRAEGAVEFCNLFIGPRTEAK